MEVIEMNSQPTSHTLRIHRKLFLKCGVSHSVKIFITLGKLHNVAYQPTVS